MKNNHRLFRPSAMSFRRVFSLSDFVLTSRPGPSSPKRDVPILSVSHCVYLRVQVWSCAYVVILYFFLWSFCFIFLPWKQKADLCYQFVRHQFQYTVFAEINARPEISAHQKQWFFKGGTTQNQWLLMGDFSKGGVHKTNGFWWVIFQRGEYTKPMAFDGWFFKGGGGGVHKTNGFWWVWECLLLLLKN